ncbi:hypothetical protein TCAL_14526 [Tigriopus californicus]|uniref:Uncharacterized protein n=2 Tax=Tigriopus californicus TaxID=6832 RepID=A0A553PRS2_TIGCA|nr:hypothetical protein TCAL_14526 [Tigriopus californicus]
MKCQTLLALIAVYRPAYSSNDKFHPTTFKNFEATQPRPTLGDVPEFKNDPMFVVPPNGTFSPLDRHLLTAQHKRSRDDISSTISPKVRAIMRHLPIGFYGYPSYYAGEFEEPKPELGPYIHREVPEGTSSEEYWKNNLISQLQDLKRVLLKVPSNKNPNSRSDPIPQLRHPVTSEETVNQLPHEDDIFTQGVVAQNTTTQASSSSFLESSTKVTLRNISELSNSAENEAQNINVTSNVVPNSWNNEGSHGQGFRLFQEGMAQSVGDYPDDAHEIHIALEGPSKSFDEFGQSDFKETSTPFMKLEDMVDDFGNITPQSKELHNPSQ